MDCEERMNPMNGRLFSTIKKKRMVIWVVLFLVLCLVVLLFFHSRLTFELFRIFLRLKTGIKVDAKGFSINPMLKGGIEHLTISLDDGVEAKTYVEKVIFDGGIGEGLRPEIQELSLLNTQVAVTIKAKGMNTLDKSSKPSSFYHDIIKKLPTIKKMDVKGGAFSVKLPQELGILRLQDVSLKILDVGPQTKGSILFNAGLSSNLSGDLRFPPGHIEFSLTLDPLQEGGSGSGIFSVSFPELEVQGIYITKLEIKAPVTIVREDIRISEFTVSAKSLEIKGEPLTSGGDFKVMAGIIYDTSEERITIKPFKAELPGMGMLEGEGAVELKSGLSWQGSLYAMDFVLTHLSELISPFLEPGQRGWAFDGKGNLLSRLEGRMIDGVMNIKGDLKIDIKEGSFSSPDGMTAGEGIEAHIELDLNYPNENREEVSLRTKGMIEGGEYLRGTLYKDLAGRSISWDSEGFFLFNQKG